MSTLTFSVYFASSIIGTEIVYYPIINCVVWMTGGCPKNRKDEVRPKSNAAEPLSCQSPLKKGDFT